MTKLTKSLPKETYKLKAKGSLPGIHSFHSLVGNLMIKCPDLEQMLVWHLLCAMVYKQVHGQKKPKIEQKLKSFYHCLQALNP
eukprot:2443446-Ditylum_brightwellii.AAC.1